MRALDEVFAATGLGQRIVSFKIWKPGGLVAHASDPALIGQRFEPKPELEAAWSGKVTGSFDDLDDAENAAEAALGVPLLEVYSPLHEVWSGRIIAVAEFYEVATELEQDLADARRTSWLLGGGHLPRQRADAPRHRPRRLRAPSPGRRRCSRRRSARAATSPRRTSSCAGAPSTPPPAPPPRPSAACAGSAPTCTTDRRSTWRSPPCGSTAWCPPPRRAGARRRRSREALQTALAEIRALSRGLSLPDLDRLSLAEVARRAVAGAPASRRAAGRARPTAARRTRRSTNRSRICLYRFLQEALSNASRHAPGADVARRGRGRRRPADRDGARRRAGVRPRRGRARDRRRRRWVSRASATAPRASAASSASTARPARGTRLILTLPLGKGDA